MAKLSRRDILAYLLLVGGVVATADPRIVQSILDSLAPPPAITARPSALHDGPELQDTPSPAPAATIQATGQSTESAASTTTPPADLPTMPPG